MLWGGAAGRAVVLMHAPLPPRGAAGRAVVGLLIHEATFDDDRHQVT